MKLYTEKKGKDSGYRSLGFDKINAKKVQKSTVKTQKNVFTGDGRARGKK